MRARSRKRSRARAWVVIGDVGSLALHDRDTRVGRSQVNTDNSTYMNVNIADKGDDTFAHQRILSTCFHRGGDMADSDMWEVRQSISTSASVSLTSSVSMSMPKSVVPAPANAAGRAWVMRLGSW